VGQHQLAARKAAVLDLAHGDAVALGDRADGDLEAQRLLVVQAAAQEFEAVAFDRRPQLDRAARQKALQQLAPADVAVRQHQRIVHAVAQPHGAPLAASGWLACIVATSFCSNSASTSTSGSGARLKTSARSVSYWRSAVQRLQVVADAHVEVHQRVRAPESGDLAAA
jgi:hypothetical protein